MTLLSRRLFLPRLLQRALAVISHHDDIVVNTRIPLCSVTEAIDSQTRAPGMSQPGGELLVVGDVPKAL